MRPLYRFKVWVVGMACVAGSVHAAEYIATPTGNYTTFPSAPCAQPSCVPYTSGMAGSGSFTTSAPLVPDLVNQDIQVQLTSFTFSDGVNTYASTDPEVRVAIFRVSTDSAGNITDTFISAMRWLTGTSPHATGDRLSVMMIGGGQSGGGHNERCLQVGIFPPSGVSDGCPRSETLPGESTMGFGGTVSWSLAPPPPPPPVAVPTVSEGAMGLMALALGALAARPLRRARARTRPSADE